MRLFFALWLPEELAQTLAEQAHLLARQYGGTATRQETIHLTLAFLGEVDEARLPSVLQAAHAVSAAPFALTVDRLGFWRHNRLLWAGCSAPAPGLLVLVESLRERLRASSIACDEAPRFAPHLTLVRKVRAYQHRGPPDLPTLEPLGWPCGSFFLVRSQPTSAGSGYFTVAEFPLGNGPALTG